MKTRLFAPLPRLRRAGIVTLATVFLACLPAAAQEAVVTFSGASYLPGDRESGDVELARVPKSARSALQTLYPFAPAMPKMDYSGPAFSLGYEVRASAPSNLTVAPDKAVMENNFPNGADEANDTISITSYGDWPEDNRYSVAVLVIFPTDGFALEELSYSALNWTHNKAYNDKLRHRWVVRLGDKYYVSTAFLGRTGRATNEGKVDVIRAARAEGKLSDWVPYDPTKSIFADLGAPRVKLGQELDEVTAVGFYADALDFPGAGPGKRQWQFRLLSFGATGHAGAR